MSIDPARAPQLIWATRGRSWGFRFLLDAGLSDPLPEYERAFGTLRDESTAWRREAGRVALRIQDPLGRRDSAGRVIPHEFVVFEDLSEAVTSVEDGLRVVWPLVADVYASVWDADDTPSATDLNISTATDRTTDEG